MGAKLQDIGKLIQDAVKSKEVLEEAAKVIIESVPLRTRLGKGVMEPEGPTHSLPKLKDKTKYNRSLLRKRGELTGPGATPAKSGLNAKGDLLTGLKAKVTPGRVEITLQDSEQTKKADNLLKQNRLFQFMNISKAESNRMVKAMSEKITQILKKIDIDSL